MSQADADRLEELLDLSGFNADVETARKFVATPFVRKVDLWHEEVKEMARWAEERHAQHLAKLSKGKE